MTPKPEGTKVLNMNIDKGLLERVERYRFRQMFPTQSEAIEFLLQHALKANPARPGVQKAE